jgi:hypothetical protein
MIVALLIIIVILMIGGVDLLLRLIGLGIGFAVLGAVLLILGVMVA